MRGMTVRDLLETPHFRMSLVAGEEGLGRRISWAHISEMEDPAPWLDGGELLIANGWGVPRTGHDQASYIRRLSERGAVAVALGAHAPRLHAAMRAKADALGFPLMRVAREVPFVAIARMVSDYAQDVAHQRLTSHIRMFDTLRLLAEGNIGQQRLFSRLEEIGGFRLFLMSESGRRLLPTVPPPPDDVIAYLLNPERPLPGIPGGYAITVPVAGRTAGYLVALEDGDGDFAGLSAVRHVATIAAIQLADLYREREWQRRESATILAEVLDGRLDRPALESALQRFGFTPMQLLQLAFVSSDDGKLSAEWIHHRLADAGTPSLMSMGRNRLALLVPAGADPFALLLSNPHLRIGVSQMLRAGGDWPAARAEAMWALQHAESAAETRVIHYSTSGSMDWLPPDLPSLRSLVDRILGPVIEYDRARESQLVESLRTYLEHDRQLSSAADKLYIHKHTLSYRLRRVEELTGRRPSRTRDVAELWLALQAQEVLDAWSA